MATISIILSTYKSQQFLATWLANAQRQSMWGRCELIVAANDPDCTERRLLEEFAASWPGQVTLQVVEREGLYRSWNRCLALAKGRYIAIANVDDLRTSTSLETQYNALEQHPDCGFCYGNWRDSDVFPPNNTGRVVHSPPYDPEEFTRGMHIGPFFIWRQDLTAAGLYFDEQFQSGGDFDLQIRLALASRGHRVSEILGDYYVGGQGLSRGNRLQPIEALVICLRYGIYDNIHYYFDYLPEATRYNIPNLVWDGNWRPVERLFPDYRAFLQDRQARWFALGLKRLVMRYGQRRIVDTVSRVMGIAPQSVYSWPRKLLRSLRLRSQVSR